MFLHNTIQKYEIWYRYYKLPISEPKPEIKNITFIIIDTFNDRQKQTARRVRLKYFEPYLTTQLFQSTCQHSKYHCHLCWYVNKDRFCLKDFRWFRNIAMWYKDYITFVPTTCCWWPWVMHSSARHIEDDYLFKRYDHWWCIIRLGRNSSFIEHSSLLPGFKSLTASHSLFY